MTKTVDAARAVAPAKNLAVLAAILTFGSVGGSAAHAAPAPTVSQFDVVAVTSAIYNPVLPSPLTPLSALTDMIWDVVPGSSSYKISSGVHGGGWMAFVTETRGYPVNGAPPSQTYKGTPIIYFGTVNIIDSANTVIGFYDEYYCSPCTSQGTFSANTVSINTGRYWSAQMYAQ